jgi:cytochrome c
MRLSPLFKILGMVVLAAAFATACDEAEDRAVGPADEIESMLQAFEKGVEKEAAAAAKKAKEVEAAAEGTVLAGDATAGQKVFKKCAVCHTAEKEGPHKVGPNLWNVVGNKKASAEGFSYSTAMKEAGGNWTEADLDQYLTSPKKFLPGNRMAFAGVRKAKDRANLIAYLKSLAD